MHITALEITLAETINLGDYSNTRPSITVRAELAPHDEPVAVLEALIELASTPIHAQIDAELIRSRLPPRYDTGPRFHVFRFSADHTILILPRSVRPTGELRPHTETYHPTTLAAATTIASEVQQLFSDCTIETFETAEAAQPRLNELRDAERAREALRAQEREARERAWRQTTPSNDAA